MEENVVNSSATLKIPVDIVRTKYREVEYIWQRRNCGTYPKWIASIGRHVLKFIFGKKIKILFRGRGSRVAAAKKYGFRLNADKDLPVRYAKKVAVYITWEK